MSRIGKKIINIPKEATVKIEGRLIRVSGPKGELVYSLHPAINASLSGSELSFSLAEKAGREAPALWGTNRQLVANMVAGVTVGYEKKLEVNGVGFKAELKGRDLVFSLGFSHSVIFPLPDGIQATVEKNLLTLRAIDKQLLGETAAKIRSLKKPEPYKGKGIKYLDEVITRKAGKKVKSASG